MKKMYFLLMVALSSLFLLTPIHAAEPVKVGMILPYSGVYAGLGKEITRAFELGLEVFGDEVNGRKIVLVQEDTEGKPNSGLSKTKKLIFSDKVDVLVGPVSSGVLAAMRDTVHNSKTPFVIANAGHDGISGAKCSPWIVRTSFSNRQVVRPMGKWMYDNGYRKVYLMAPDYAAGHQMMDHFKAGFKEAGGTIIGEEYPPLQGTKDFGPYLAKVKEAKPDALFVFFAGGPAIQFVKSFGAFGLGNTIPLAGAGWLTSPLYIKAQGEGANNIIGSANYIPSIDNAANKAYQDAFKAKHKREGSEFAVQGYDSARVIVEALKAVNGDTSDKKAFMDAIRAVTFDGPRGKMRFDSKNGNIIQNIYVYKNSKTNGVIAPSVFDVIKDVQDPSDSCTM
ncbi:MAG: ABC transporter substrate-binding protein [SAR324 cluster bacterium]|nr:ABC transporter substrate-binding protein [SAR324 cluster bacterium]